MTDRKADLPRRPLADLLAYIEGPARLASALDDSSDLKAASPVDVEGSESAAARLRRSYPELPLLDDFKATWIKLSANRQLERAEEQVPENAGPLHSSRLVTQSLALMQSLSPAYLHTFMAYLDALSWTEQLLAEHTASQESARAAQTKGATTPQKPRARKKKTP